MVWPLTRNKVVKKPDNVVTRWRFQRLNFKRLYKAASQDRLTADWLSTGGDLNQELESQLSIVRARARELEQNSNICRRYL